MACQIPYLTCLHVGCLVYDQVMIPNEEGQQLKRDSQHLHMKECVGCGHFGFHVVCSLDVNRESCVSSELMHEKEQQPNRIGNLGYFVNIEVQKGRAGSIFVAGKRSEIIRGVAEFLQHTGGNRVSGVKGFSRATYFFESEWLAENHDGGGERG